jgi:outer membrane protein OmpA-like peptidoglycan-associated protein
MKISTYRKIKFSLFLMACSFLTFSLWSDDCKNARRYITAAKKLTFSGSDLIRKEKLYRQAVQLSPNCAEAHNNLGDVYEKQGKFKEAIAEYKKTIALAPKAAIPHAGIGDIYFKTNRFDRAMNWYKKALEYDPRDKITRQRLTLLKDYRESGVINSSTLVKMLTITRSAADISTVSFGEKLIPFDFNKWSIRSDAGKQLAEIGKALEFILGEERKKENGNTRGIGIVERKTEPLFEVVGHTDMRGTSAYNMELSLKRAQAVINYVVDNFAVPAAVLKPVGLGKTQPLCSSSTEDCHALNRRVEIRRCSAPGRQEE